MTLKFLHLAIFLIFSILTIPFSIAAPDNYKVTYTINIKENGSAIWNVEYRTLLSTKGDFDSFDNYTQQLKSKYLPEFMELMQRSAQEAAVATARNMTARDFKGEAITQSSPTGKYGVVHYSFTWTEFAKLNSKIVVGDVFVGGLYLSKDNTLIIQYPEGYTVEQVTPQPDQGGDGLLWYGVRSFEVGEPRIILSKPSFPWMLAFVVVLILTFGIYLAKRKITHVANNNSEIQANNIPEIEMMDIEDRILKLLKDSGGVLYQSEIGRQLNLPKSTVSSALNELHEKNLIQKIKKGRENLIRII